MYCPEIQGVARSGAALFAMNLYFHPEILAQQKYSCNCCGRGCRSFLVPVRTRERKAIAELQPWPEKLGVDKLYVRSREAKVSGYGLARRADGRCVFLDEENLCAIHRLHGLKAKPLACQLYPFVFTPFAGKLRVGLRFDCPAVCGNEGQSLTAYKKEIRQLAKQIVPTHAVETEVPFLLTRVKISDAWFDAINEILLKIVNSNALTLVQRLHWLRKFLEHLARVKWPNVGEEDFTALMEMLQGGLLAEVQKQESRRELPTGKPRKLLGQIFYLLSHPASRMVMGKGVIKRLHERIDSAGMMKQLGQTEGRLPEVRDDWPNVDLVVLETSFGSWPREAEQMLSRYLTCRIASMGYCGLNFYGFSLVEGARSLLLAMVAVGWLMRIEAVKAGRKHLELSDAQTAVMTIDGNMGYGSALGTGPSRMRLNYLSEHLESFIDWYCS